METVRWSFAVVITFPQLKGTSNQRGSKQNTHAMEYNTEKDSSTVKDPTIDILDEPHKHRSHVTVITNVSELPSQVFLLRIFLPPFLEAICEICQSQKFCEVR